MSQRRTFTDYEKKTIYAKYNGCCGICGKPVRFKKLTIDHKVPLSKGGTNALNNLQLACGTCNQAKQNFTEEEFLEKLWDLDAFNWHNMVKVHFWQQLEKVYKSW